MISQGGLYSLRVKYIESYKTQWISYKKLSSMHTQEEKRKKKENKSMKLYQVSPEKNTPIIHLLYIVKKNNLAFAHLDI